MKGCVLDLKMRDKKGTTVTDYSRYGNDGTVNGGALWPEHGMLFDGSSDYIDCSNNQSFNVTDAVTISSWIKLDGYTGNWMEIVNKNLAWSFDVGSNLVEHQGKLHANIYNIGWGTPCYGSVLNLDIWYHVVSIIEGSTVTIYKDGVLDLNSCDVGKNLTTSVNNVIIGANDVPDVYFNGTIDAVCIYNYALSQTEITNLYNERRHLYV